ncbi:hypothetical protein CRG98_019172 [Punica granatum]|uniref:Uncharacterized protein n=1 Tax=Punica granatum TaxID=22663 RepID=A0A2I0JVV7_PUNGR|nr:hypothetical protein CRG98_019172 [Punica granatum]
MGNGQFVYSNTILYRLSYTTQPSKAKSSSSTIGNQARHPSSSRQPTRQNDGRKGAQSAAGMNPCILLAWGSMLPKLSLFSLSLHNSKWVTATLQSATKAKISYIPLREFSHNTLKMTRPRSEQIWIEIPMRVTNAVALRHPVDKGSQVSQAARTTADSVSPSHGIRRHSSPGAQVRHYKTPAPREQAIVPRGERATALGEAKSNRPAWRTSNLPRQSKEQPPLAEQRATAPAEQQATAPAEQQATAPAVRSASNRATNKCLRGKADSPQINKQSPQQQGQLPANQQAITAASRPTSNRAIPTSKSCSRFNSNAGLRKTNTRGVYGYRVYPEPVGTYPNG